MVPKALDRYMEQKKDYDETYGRITKIIFCYIMVPILLGWIGNMALIVKRSLITQSSNTRIQDHSRRQHSRRQMTPDELKALPMLSVLLGCVSGWLLEPLVPGPYQAHPALEDLRRAILILLFSPIAVAALFALLDLSKAALQRLETLVLLPGRWMEEAVLLWEKIYEENTVRSSSGAHNIPEPDECLPRKSSMTDSLCAEDQPLIEL